MVRVVKVLVLMQVLPPPMLPRFLAQPVSGWEVLEDLAVVQGAATVATEVGSEVDVR